MDMVPSTILTAVKEAIALTKETGQEFTIITIDQQLYKILIDLLWVSPLLQKKVIARLGGMHFLMSFIGCIGNLLTNTGLVEIMKAAFGRVEKMLLGKKYFPQNVRALRMVVEELLRPWTTSVMLKNSLNSYKIPRRKARQQNFGSTI